MRHAVPPPLGLACAAPLCEALEGRQLLSTAASTVASGMPAWRSEGGTTAADIAHAHTGGGEGFHGFKAGDVAAQWRVRLLHTRGDERGDQGAFRRYEMM